MAKKTENLSVEERLEQALVADCEQPYKVPENWVWTNINTINKYLGKIVDPSKVPEKLFELYSVPSSADNYPEVITGAEIGSSKQEVKKGDVLLCKINPRINRVWKVSQHTDNLLLASSEWIVIRNAHINTEYLLYYFSSQCFRAYMLSNVSGVGGSLMRAQPKYVQMYPVPLPPLAEQQRIVDRIESMFSKLDEAKEKAQTALDSFENRKAAILHKAFTGELTAKWREENGVGLNSWEETVLQDECEKITCGKTPTNDISTTGEIPFLKVYNIVDNKIEFDYKAQYIPASVSEAKLKSSILKPNDVIMNIVGPPLRKIAIIPNTYPQWNMNQAIVRFRVKNRLNPHFLYYSLIYPYTLDEVIAETKGVVGQANISVTQSRNLKILRPTLTEQIEIVRILDSLFAKEQKAKELADVIEKIDLMKKAILARAFRGELGTNDPEEESAIGLLKGILR